MAQYLTLVVPTGGHGSFTVKGQFDMSSGVWMLYGPGGWIHWNAIVVKLDQEGKDIFFSGSIHEASGTNVRITVKFAGAASYSVINIDASLNVHGPLVVNDPHAEAKDHRTASTPREKNKGEGRT